MIEREDTEKIAAHTRPATVDGHVLWDIELVRLEAAQQ